MSTSDKGTIDRNKTSKSNRNISQELVSHPLLTDENKTTQNQTIPDIKVKGHSKCVIILFLFIAIILIVTTCVWVKHIKFSSQAVLLISNSEMKKPLIDKRNYRVIRLKNNLEITLISDVTTNKAAASLSVGVGSLNDDPQIQGLAHFTEHMLFLGSKTFPHPSTFEGYLSSNLGQSNAFTDQERTTYFFEIAPEGYEKALEMFSKMFTEPLLEESYMNKEIEAVNSEHLKNINIDEWREYQLMKSLAEPEKKGYGQFSTGNNSTLRSVGLEKLHEAVEMFVRKYYIPSNMKLVLLSTHSLDDMEMMAEIYFSPLASNENITHDQRNLTTQGISPENLGQIIWHNRISQGHKLNVVFFLDEIKTKYKTQPLDYVAYLFKDSKNGSLFYDLKENSLASKLEVSVQSMNSFSLMIITISLTSTGLDNVNEVIMKTFNYLKVVQSQKIQFKIYEELRNISMSVFNYLEVSSDYGKRMAKISIDMFNFNHDMQNLLYGEYLFTDYDEACIKKYIDQMTVENALIMVGSNEPLSVDNKFSELSESGTVFLKTQKIETWYGTLYNNNKVSVKAREDMKTSEESTELFSIRKTNKFITKYDTIIQCDKKSESADACESEIKDIPPINEVNYTDLKIWHKLDRSFMIPKVNCHFNLIPNALRANRTTQNNLQDSLMEYYYFLIYLSYLKSAIETELSDAITAGNKFEIILDENGITLFINSYSDVNQDILEQVFSLVFHPQISEINIKRLREMTFELIDNSKTQQPYEKALLCVGRLVKIGVINHIDMEKVMKQITKYPVTTATIVAKISSMVEGLSINSLLYGNISKLQVQQIGTILHDLSNQKETTMVEANVDNIISRLHMNRDIPGSIILRMKNDLTSEVNHVILNTYQFGRRDIKVSLLGTIISLHWDNIFYYQLRTIKQLGYIVFARKLMKDNFLSFQILIQGNTKTPDQMNIDIDLVIKELDEKINGLTENELEGYKNILIGEFNKPDANLKERSENVWKEIYESSYEFTRKDKIVKMIPLIRKEEVIEQFKKIFFSDVHKLSIQIYGGTNCEISLNNERYFFNETVISQVTDNFDILN